MEQTEGGATDCFLLLRIMTQCPTCDIGFLMGEYVAGGCLIIPLMR